MSVFPSIASAPRAVQPLLRYALVCLLCAANLPLIAVERASASGIDHLVISEIATGGASASDELIELYNPSAWPLPLEGLELVYVTASGATVSRRAAWELGAPSIGPGSHLLVANELGAYAPIADVVYASGMAASGGSVALRIQGGSTAIDAVGWGTAAGAWLEGTPVPAPPAGSSVERLPGGASGSTIDTNDNAADFALRSSPDPQNAGSLPVPNPTAPSPTASPSPTALPSPTATPTPLPTASATPVPTSISIASARALPDDSAVTIEGDALTASDFTDGGGYVADESGGIAVLLDGGSFARGDRVRVHGQIDDRFAQRTVRVAAGDIAIIGPGDGPAAAVTATGSIAEPVEGRLVRVAGTIDGSPTVLSGGLAFDVDDGSGPARVIVGSGTGIHTAAWTSGAVVDVVGVVGQRDSTGTGSSGYRVQPRDAADVNLVAEPTPTAAAGGTASPDPTPSASPGERPVISVAAARAAPKNSAVTVRGVVTLASGTVDEGSAVIQDATGAILLRLGDEAGAVSRGELVEVSGVRSTKSGMESIRAAEPPRRLGTAAEPAAASLRTGEAGEASEARLFVARGAVVATARRASSGTVTFEIDDGSGPLRVVLGATLGAEREALVAGTWVEATGVLGQETTGAQPLRGYRLWPREPGEVRVVAAVTDRPTASDGSGPAESDADGGGGSATLATLGAIDGAALGDLRVGATLVAAEWREMGVAGLLWDGVRLVGIAPASGARVEAVLEGRVPPLSVELLGLRERPAAPGGFLETVSLGDGPRDTVVGAAPPAAPTATMPSPGGRPAWVSLIGDVISEGSRQRLRLDGATIAIEHRCREGGPLPDGRHSVVGVGLADPHRIIVGCGGARRAPELALLTAARIGTPADGPSAASSPPEAIPPAGDANQLPALLLLLGVAVLTGATVLARRLRADDLDDRESEEPMIEGPPTQATQLALVRLPSEQRP